MAVCDVKDAAVKASADGCCCQGRSRFRGLCCSQVSASDGRVGLEVEVCRWMLAVAGEVGVAVGGRRRW